jgi:hypothetical protein
MKFVNNSHPLKKIHISFDRTQVGKSKVRSSTSKQQILQQQNYHKNIFIQYSIEHKKILKFKQSSRFTKSTKMNGP